MSEELKKPECPFCYVSCCDPNCSVVGCNGTKNICRKALYCGAYPYSKFCTPDSCKEELKAYFDECIERSAKDMLETIMETLLKNGTINLYK